MKVAIIVGHDERSQGAYSRFLNKTEYQYNSAVASHLTGIADIYRRPIKRGYKSAMQALAMQLNAKDYDLVIELHFNAATSSAEGVESLHFGGNDFTKMYAESYCSEIAEHYGSVNRGAKSIYNENQRGYWFLKLTKAPALIVEPFFGSNQESLRFQDPEEYACVIKQWIEKL